MGMFPRKNMLTDWKECSSSIPPPTTFCNVPSLTQSVYHMSSSAATEKACWLAGYEGNPTEVKTGAGVNPVIWCMNEV
jgi:hypothetical protein